MQTLRGFTIIELVVAISVITILTAMALFVPTQALPASRDTERTNDNASIARRLEQAYAAQETGGPSYPSTTNLLSNISSKSGTVARLDIETFNAPGSSTSAVVAATSNSTTSPKGANSPVLNEYVYQPLTSTGALCTGSAICVRFFLYYRLEQTGAVISLKSLRQQ